MGSVLVPQGSVSYVTGGSVDHFYGYIEVSRPAKRIHYAVGMAGRRPRGLRARGYIWLKRERLAGGGRLTYGLRVEGGMHVVDANVGIGNFSMASTGDADIDAFLSVVRTYGHCSGCPTPISRRAAT